MAAADRQLGRNLQVFTLGSFDLVASIRECEVERGFDVQENRALKDAVHYDQPITETWQITFRAAVDTADYNTPSLINSLGSSVAVNVDLGAVTYSANPALLKSMSHSVPDGLQEINFVISNQGDPLTAG